MLGNLRMKKTALVLALLGAAACGDSDDKKDDANGNGSGNEDAGEAACGPDPMNTAASASTGSIKGKVLLGDMVKPGGTYAAKGDLYVAVLPVFDVSNACPGDPEAPVAVANALIRCVDFTKGAVEFEVNGIPPRAEPYVVIPFVDVNGNVDPSKPETAGPDTCDLLGAVPPPEATVTAAGDVAMVDLTLGSDAAILSSICMLSACK